MTSRPDVTCDPNDGPKTTAQWFNTSCFRVLTLAETGERPGNAGRNTVRGPGFQRTDLSVFKNFDFADPPSHPGAHRRLQHLEPAALRSAERHHRHRPFGQITSAEDGRIIQLGIKYIF